MAIAISHSNQEDAGYSADGLLIGERWAISAGSLLLMLLLTVLLIVASYTALADMVATWVQLPEYSHAPLIPLIAAYLAWQKRPQLRRVAPVGSWAGLTVVLIAALVCLIGKFGSAYFLVQVAFLIGFYGVILSALGWRSFRLLSAPLLILAFMIPLPPSVNSELSTTLQMWSSHLGVSIIRLFGIAVYQEGNVIDLGQMKLQVAEACSGLRYLYPLMTLGFIVGYVYKGALWQRLVLFLSSVPLTIIMNSFRIGVIGVLVDRYGGSMAEGFLHEFEGWMVFMLCTLILMWEAVLLNRLGSHAGTLKQLFNLSPPACASARETIRPYRLSRPLIASAGAICALTLAALLMPYRVDATPVRHEFLDFPLTLGAWQGRRAALESIYLDTLKLDDYILADYNSATNTEPAAAVNLYVAYYAAQRNGLATLHTPKNCLPAGGWAIREFAQRSLSNIGGRALRVNRVVIQQGDQRALVYYWFQERGRSMTNVYAVKAAMFWDAIARNRTDGAMVRVMTPLPALGSDDRADVRLSSFARLAATQLPRFVPD